MMMRRTLLTVALTVWTCAACSGEPPVDIGDHVTGSQLSDYAGMWDGYAEAVSFSPSTSDRLRLTIDDNGQGTIEFGDEPLLPPPTDPQVTYPADFASRYPGGVLDTEYRVTSGFRYPIRALQVVSDHLKLGVLPKDPFSAWCSLQTSIAIPNGDSVSYSCSTQVDLCANGFIPCTCSASGCAVVPPTSSDQPGRYAVQIAAALNERGSELTGTLLISESTREARIAIILRRD